MTALLRELTAVLQPGMAVPPELERLYEWITHRGQTRQHEHHTTGWLDAPTESATVTRIRFRADGIELLEHWLGTDDPMVLKRLCVFAQTGAEGSTAALWLDDLGRQQIVHMGSGSGSTTICLLGETPLDFLRLLAIGYGELCWSKDWHHPPLTDEGEPVDAESAYRGWLTSHFGVTIPVTATALTSPAEMGDPDPTDPFARWVESVTG